MTTTPRHAHAEAWARREGASQARACTVAQRLDALRAPRTALYVHRGRWMTWEQITNEESRQAVVWYFAAHGWGHPDDPKEES